MFAHANCMLNARQSWLAAKLCSIHPGPGAAVHSLTVLTGLYRCKPVCIDSLLHHCMRPARGSTLDLSISGMVWVCMPGRYCREFLQHVAAAAEIVCSDVLQAPAPLLYDSKAKGRVLLGRKPLQHVPEACTFCSRGAGIP